MNKNSIKLAIFAGIAAFFVSVVTTPNVVAQETESQSGANIIEEITVTVRKREESLQDVPISITAYNEAMLTNKGVKRLRDLEFSVPNMTFTEQGNAFGGFGIRGIYTLVRSIGVESGVSVYVDGVYQGRNSNANIDVIDVERIEVLKGPQGTLFGRNTISGAVNIVIKQPGDEFEGKINSSYGNLDRIGANISLSGPIMEDKLYARFVVSHYERDGFTENLFNGQDLDNEDRQSGRLNLRYLPDDDLEINFSLDGFRDRGDTPRGGYLVTNTPGRFWRVDTEFAQLSDPRVTSLDNSPSNNIGIFEERDIWGTSVSADYRFSNDYTLTSITAYREGNFRDCVRLRRDRRRGGRGDNRQRFQPIYARVENQFAWWYDILIASRRVRFCCRIFLSVPGHNCLLARDHWRGLYSIHLPQGRRYQARLHLDRNPVLRQIPGRFI